MTLFSSVIGFVQAFVLMSLSFHPIHVSVTDIKLDEKEKELEITMRVFMDDLESAFRNELKQPDLDINEAEKDKKLDGIVGEYLKKHFKVTLDNKTQVTTYLGHESEGDAYIFYVQVLKAKKFKTIQVQNTIIMDTYDDQSNIVHVTVGEKVKSLRLMRNTPVDKLTFDVK